MGGPRGHDAPLPAPAGVHAQSVCGWEAIGFYTGVSGRSVRCTAPGEGMFTGVAVELDAANRIFTTLPVVPVPERMSQE